MDMVIRSFLYLTTSVTECVTNSFLSFAWNKKSANNTNKVYSLDNILQTEDQVK